MARLGPLLRNILDRIDRAGPEFRGRVMGAVAAHVGAADAGERLPLVLQLKRRRPRRGEVWPEYRDRVAGELRLVGDALSGGTAEPLVLANALAGSFEIGRIGTLAARNDIDLVELDPVVDPTLMDDAVVDIGLEPFRNRNGPLTGTGVRVAVLDSGIDLHHPFLAVAASVSTCGEDVEIPGRHATHCAGSLASCDAVFPGIAPDVTLVNIKVLRHDGSGRHTDVVKGVDAALDLMADVLSLSLGFNHLPTWSDGGHGWSCPDGRCPLCTAVDNAVAFGALACVAAGNEHERAEALRRFGHGQAFDTELACPGQSRGALAVGALTKRTFLPADFSSRGPAAFGASKPDLAGPGVNVMSTVPVPRLADGEPVAEPRRADLFARASGTSMATPIVAGALALVRQARREQGLSVAPRAIRKAFLEQAVTGMPFPANVVGAGRVDLGRYGAIIATA